MCEGPMLLFVGLEVDSLTSGIMVAVRGPKHRDECVELESVTQSSGYVDFQVRNHTPSFIPVSCRMLIWVAHSIMSCPSKQILT